MDRDCFIAFLKRYSQRINTPEKSTTLLSFLRKYCKKAHAFEPAVLHVFLNSIDTADYSKLSADITAIWKTYNRSLRLPISRMERAGLYAEADSLYGDLNTLSPLSVYDLLGWARIRGVLGNFSGAAELFCLASTKDKAMVNPALNQLKRLLMDVSAAEYKRQALQMFSECYQSHAGADLDSLSQWLSAAYAHFDLFLDEERAITRLDKNPRSKGNRLLKTARHRFARNLFAEALPAARKAWRYITREPHRQKCALILYQSYLHTGKSDSALLWLEKVDLTHTHGKANAVVLYQNSGFLQKADSILGTLSKSITRDTLTIRQHLVTGPLSKARSFIAACRKETHWGTTKREIYLWEFRCAVYEGAMSRTALYLDSITNTRYPPSWTYTSEVLTTQLALKRVGRYPEAFKYWGKLQHAIITNTLIGRSSGFSGEKWPKPVREYLAGTLIGALINNKLYERAQLVIDSIPVQNNPPQIQYYRALVSFMLGNNEKARSIFKEIILASPDDVFAQKARIYLLKLKEFHSM